MSYIGNDLRSGRSEIYHYTSASGGETTITSLADGRSINYTVGWCTVYLNGVRMHDSDVTLTSGSSVVFGSALSAGDVVIVEASHTFSVSDSVPKSGGTFDGAVIFDGSIQQKTTTQNLSGTYSTERMYLNDSYTLTGDVNVTGHLALGSIADEDIVITQDGTERTITGSGTLEAGELLSSKETDLTKMTGVLANSVQDNVTRLGTVTTGTFNGTLDSTTFSGDAGQITAKAWGRIENNNLTNNHGIGGFGTTGAGSSIRYYTITMSPAMANDDYAVVTNGYSHEGGEVEGTVQWYTGNVTGTPSTTQFAIRFAGNGTPNIDCIGFAVFGT